MGQWLQLEPLTKVGKWETELRVTLCVCVCLCVHACTCVGMSALGLLSVRDHDDGEKEEEAV